MNKEKLFEELKENIKNVRAIGIDEGKFMLSEDMTNINILDVNTNKLYWATYIPYDFENEHIDLRIRKKLAKEFINTYTFTQIKSEFIEEQMQLENEIKFENENLPRLQNLKIKIDELLKNYYSRESEISYYQGYNKYILEFSCKKNKYQSEGFRIALNKEKFQIMHTEKISITESEILEILKKLEPEFKEYKNEVDQEHLQRKIKAIKELTIGNFIYDLNIPKGKIIIFKNKNSYIAFTGNLRYALGTGKSGKYINCNKSKMEDIILNKNINEYVFAEDKLYTTEELKGFNYNKIIA